jgi:hypothetical protein
MAQIIFDNPNSPEQPAKGVYRWFFRMGEAEVTLYVGCAGNRRETASTPSTLKRGIQEAQRSCVTSDKGKLLDTDFVVGTTLLFVKQQGYDCIWQHVSDDPKDEVRLSAQYRPLLQTAVSHIHRHFRIPKPNNELWSSRDIGVAEQLLLSLFATHLSIAPAGVPSASQSSVA